MSTRPADRPSTRLPRIALAWSLACCGLAAWWVSDPSRNPLHTSDEPVSLLGVLQPRAGAVVCLAFGLLAAAVAARLVRTSPGPVPTSVVAVGAATALFFGVVAPDVQLLAFFGYAMALLGGPVLVGLLLAGARRHRVNLVVLALIGTAVGLGVATGQIGSPTLELFDEIRAGTARVGVRPLVVAFLACGGVLLGAAVLAVTGGATSREARDRLARWGRVATLVAALGPIPYGLLRMTWATPWPQGLGGGGEEILEGGIRVFGLCLGLSALCGSVLTLGLLARWGEVWPRWLPGLRGRPVPVKAAVIPASLVAVALCAASVSLVVLSVREGGIGLLLAVPAPVWGPALLLATYSYYRRRTDPPLSEPDPTSSRSRDRAVS